MKFPRNARIFRGQLEMAPFACVFFLLVIFLVLGSLVYTPGVRLELPSAGDLPGLDKPTVAVAIDKNGQLFFENQLIDEPALGSKLRQAAKNSPAPLTLIVQADKAVSNDRVVHLALLAREAGLADALLATLPRALASPAASAGP
jgi:biopolymer transport protein ExbD